MRDFSAKIALYLAYCLVFAGGLALGACALYATWLFWTDPSWAYAKFIGIMVISGPILALITLGLLHYAERDKKGNP